MKLKENYFYTLREDVKDEDSISGNLLSKAGFIKKSSAGVYMMLPLGLKVQNKIEGIIRKNMNEAGALELRMPALIAQEYYEKSGRLENFGSSIFRLKDRSNKPFNLGPTHEELFAVAAKMMIRSYKNLPFNIYQFQTKFRDEPRARFGLIRVKEFVMKDAYSFDTDEAGLNISYDKMFNAYKKSFDEMGIDYRIVKADTGVMGGLLSEEFQAITPIGEDTVVYCDECGYTSNLEIAKCVHTLKDEEAELEKELVETPHASSIEDVCAMLNVDTNKSVKALLLNIDGEFVVCFIRGDRELNETKVQKLLGANEVGFANDEMINNSKAVAGYTGPIDLDVKVIIDEDILNMKNFVCGANKEGYHYKNVNIKDIKYDMVADIVNVKDGDVCPVCGKPLKFTKGIEVGNTFKLGTKYSKALDLTYLNAENKNDYVWMGSYGIGIGRCMAALVEQNHDEKGIIWPLSVAPFTLAIANISNKDETQVKVADELYDYANSLNIDVLYDNRDERPGVKFNDLELIGIPYRLTVGRKVSEGILELKDRKTGETKEMTIDEVKEFMKTL